MAVTWSERQQQRGIKLNLTWFAARNCWKKKINGKVFYFKFPNSAEGYQAALLELAKQTTPDDRFGYTDQWGEWTHSPGMSPTRGDVLNQMITADPKWADTAQAIITGNPKSDTHTLGQKIDEFLSNKRHQATQGKKAPGTFKNLKVDLTVVEQFFKAPFPMKQMDGTNCKAFFVFLRDKSTGRFLGDDGKPKLIEEGRRKQLWRSFSQFMRAYWRQDDTQLTALPKIFDDPEYRFGDYSANEDDADEANKIEQLFTPAELKAAMTLTPRWKAFILLMANCAFTQADIAVLKRRQITDDGRLNHKRKKTRRHQNPPTVSYKLWPETIEAIRAVSDLEKLGPNDLVFLNERGQPLITEKIVEKDGVADVQKWDNIGHRWAELINTAKVPNKTLKWIRKTGATEILHSDHGAVRGLYLGHAPASIADKHYAFTNAKPFKPLDKATDYLRKALKIG